MRIHLQNPIDDPLFDFSAAQWEAAAARAPDIGRGHAVTVGVTGDDFTKAMAEAEAVVADVSVVGHSFRVPHPG